MKVWILILICVLAGRAHAAQDGPGDIGPIIAGVAGHIFVHEAGHAATAAVLGYKIDKFRPYPSRVTYTKPDGSEGTQWVLGYVKYKIPTDVAQSEQHLKDHLWIAAMGSGAEALSVIALAPLLTSLSGFGAASLYNTLFINNFTFAITPLSQIIHSWWFKEEGTLTGDWSQVSRLSKVHLGWYAAGTLLAGAFLYTYLDSWRDRAEKTGSLPLHTTTLNLGWTF